LLRTIAESYRQAFSGLPRPIWTLASVTLVNRAGTMVLPFLILYLTTERGLPPRQAGSLLAVYGFGSMLGAWLGGWLSDRIGAVRVQGFSLGLSGLAFLILGELESITSIAAALAMLAVFAESFRPANAAALAHLSPPEVRLRAFALRRLAINVGMTLGPAIGGFLAVIDYQWLFRVDGATCLASALLLRLMLWKREGEAEEERATEADGAVVSPWNDRLFLGFLVLTFLLASVFFQIVSTFPLTLREIYGMSEDRIGLVLASNTVLIVLFEMVLTHRLERRPPLKVLALGAFLACLGFALLPLGTTFVFVLGTVVIWTFGEMIAAPTSEGFVASRAAPSARGRFMGLYVMSWSLAFVVAPVAGTFVYSRFGPGPLWLGCGLLGVVLACGFLVLASRHTHTGD